MDGILLPPMDRRLQQRYCTLVKAHLHSSSPVAAGPTVALDQTSGWAATQATWRFLNNDRVSLSALMAPLREAGCEAADQIDSPWALVVHDWSKLDYGGHASKRDTVQLTHEHDVGYELSTALLVSAQDGAPLAPMQMHLKTAAGAVQQQTGPTVGGTARMWIRCLRRWGRRGIGACRRRWCM